MKTALSIHFYLVSVLCNLWGKEFSHIYNSPTLLPLKPPLKDKLGSYVQNQGIITYLKKTVTANYTIINKNTYIFTLNPKKLKKLKPKKDEKGLNVMTFTEFALSI